MPFDRGYGPGSDRNWSRSGPSPAGRQAGGRPGGRGGHRSAPPLTPDEVDALMSTVGRVAFVALDFETTGLVAARDRVVEIGALAFRLERGTDGWVAIEGDTVETLVNPGCPIPAEVSAIHGIDDLSVSAAPSFAEALPSLMALLGNAIIVAHNAPFDLGFLREECARAGIDFPPNPAYDTIQIAKATVSGLPSYSLGALAASFGIHQSAAHRGGDDARVCMQIFTRCVNLLESKTG